MKAAGSNWQQIEFTTREDKIDTRFNHLLGDFSRLAARNYPAPIRVDDFLCFSDKTGRSWLKDCSALHKRRYLSGISCRFDNRFLAAIKGCDG